MTDSRSNASVLLCFTGLRIEGGIACVNRCIARALDEELAAGRLTRVDRVLLQEDPEAPAPPSLRGEQHLARGNKARFVGNCWRTYRRGRHDLVLFDLVGLARGAILPLPGFPPRRFGIFTHWQELPQARGRLHRAAFRRASILLSNSEFSARKLGTFLGEDDRRIRAVPLCVDPARLDEWKSFEAPESVDREPAVLCVARMVSHQRGKGHDALIEAWPEIVKRSPEARLRLVGHGDDVPRLREKANVAGVSDAVRFLGHLEGRALYEQYRRASVFAMPSRQEGFGIVYAEAMWNGLPCIGSTADASGELIADGETGLLVEYGSAAGLVRSISSLLSNPGRAAAMGAAGRQRVVEQFSFERFKSNLLAALDLGSARA